MPGAAQPSPPLLFMVVAALLLSAGLTACSGLQDDGPSPPVTGTPAPVATATPTVTPTAPAALAGTPTALATPTATPPPPCAEGAPVPDAASTPDLVADCDTLLALRDTLGGTGVLNWSADTAITSWTGVTVGGTPQRVTSLSLANSALTGELSGLLGNLTGLTELRLNGNSLTGMIPSKLSELANLTHVSLAGNTFSGCAPTPLRAVTNNGIDSLGLTGCGQPTDISTNMQSHRLVEGTYQFRVRFSGPLFTFDVPAGVRLRIKGIRLTTPLPHTPDSRGRGLIDTATESFICLEMLRAGEECGRLVVGDDTGVIEGAFDKIIESAWIQ